jgi:hypothetical protein
VLRAVGVLDSFAVIVDESPTGPDHELADEPDWWASVDGDTRPMTVVGVRDLDLVDPDEWPAALRLLAAQPDTRRALADPRGYSAWWLTRFALLAGHPPREWRLADAVDLDGLYDPVPVDLPAGLLADLGVRDRLAVTDLDQAADLLDRLADPARTMPVGLAFRVHAVLAEAALTEVFDPAEVDPPDRVRALSGDAVPAADVAVLDRPWLLAVLGAARVVAARGSALDGALADLLNVPLASELITDAPSSAGEPVAWTELGAVRLACALLDVPVPAGSVVLHDELTVADTRVPWWVDGQVVHAEDSMDGLARALAWATDRWADRWQLAAVLNDPAPGTALA